MNFIFDGRSYPAKKGQSVAAALLVNGITTFRTTRFENKPRSLFCGIGICFDCLLIINGVANTRSCLIEVSDGMIINTQVGAGE